MGVHNGSGPVSATAKPNGRLRTATYAWKTVFEQQQSLVLDSHRYLYLVRTVTQDPVTRCIFLTGMRPFSRVDKLPKQK